jgi:hypothetical protein
MEAVSSIRMEVASSIKTEGETEREETRTPTGKTTIEKEGIETITKTLDLEERLLLPTDVQSTIIKHFFTILIQSSTSTLRESIMLLQCIKILYNCLQI